MQSKLVPMPGFLIVEPIKEDVGAIVIQTNEDDNTKGRIVAIGREVINEWGTTIKCPEELKVGDTVLVRHWGHEVLEMDGKKLKAVKFLDVMALIVNEE